MLSELDLQCKQLLLLWNNKTQGICIFLSPSKDICAETTLNSSEETCNRNMIKTYCCKKQEW